MKPSTTITALISLACALSAQAHDPSQHKNNGEKPRCEALKGMDLETMDRNDPVVQAVLKKCEKQLHSEKQPEHQSEHKEEYNGKD